MPMNFERAADTESVIVALRGCNDEISYRSLANQTSLTVERTKQVLASARRVLVNEKIMFGVVRGEGLRRLTDNDIVDLPPSFHKRVFKGAGRQLKYQGCINDFAALGKAKQHTQTINLTILNALRRQANVKAEPPPVKLTPQPMPNVTQLIKAKS